MNKYQFLAAVREGLNGIEKSDIDKSLDYYREMIDDRIDDGLTEEEAVAALGPVEKIVAEIRAGAKGSDEDSPVSEEPEGKSPAAEKTESKSDVGGEKREKSITDIIGDAIKPISGVIRIIISICFWCVAIPVLIAGVSVGVASLALLFSAFVMLFTGEIAQFALMLGGALCAVGIGVLVTVGTVMAIRAYNVFAKKLRSSVSDS